jgi:hypothetical protein
MIGGGRRTSRIWERWRTAAGEQAGRLLRTLRIGRAPSMRPLPRVTVAMGRWVPVLVLRVGVAAVALACLALLAPGTAIWVLGSLAAVAIVLRPSGIVVSIFAVALGLRLALTGSEPFAWRSFALLFGVHLLVQLGRLVSNVGWSARVDLGVLVSPARRFLLLQAFAQLVALGGALLTSASVTVPWLPVLVGVALTLLAWLLLSRLTDPSQGQGG